MKRLLLTVLILFTLASRAKSQNPNPQPSFSSAVLSANPSLYLNFNDATTAFKDQISGLNFGSTTVPTLVGSLPIPTAGWGANSLGVIGPAIAASGNLQTITLQFYTAPTAGTPLTICIMTGSGTSYAIAGSFTVTVAATTSLQVFVGGTDYPATAVTAGEHLGFWTATAATNLGKNPSIGVTNYYLNSQSTLPSGAQSYSSFSGGPDLQGVVVGTQAVGTITPRQPGFDSTIPNNTSAAIPYNGWSAAPNSTLGDIEWDSPWTMMVHVDRLNWNRTGTLVLASKGDSSNTNNSWWEITLQMVGLDSQLCFTRNGAGGLITNSGGSGSGRAANSLCTNNIDAMPNGFNYNIVVTDNGTGASGYGGVAPQALGMYINGLPVIGSAGVTGIIPGLSASTNYGIGFGAYQITVVSGGTGYAASTAFTVTCPGTPAIAGTFAASGGVMTTGNSGVAISSNYGCTGTPTVVLTSPTGTGATFSYQANGAYSMNSSTYPLMVPGYVSAGAYNGIDGSDTTQTATYVDEFAIFPGNLSFGQLSNIFYQTKFYQEVVKTFPAPLHVMVFDDDGGGDMDNFFALQMAIAIQKRGIMHLAGVVSEDESVTCEAMWRQMLDQAGLNNIPLSVPSAFADNSGTGFCTTANVAAYNASTPLSNAAWEPSTTMYRQIFAEYPTTPIDIVLGGPFTAMAEFMQSPADSISSLTGLQLMAQNAANGGAIYAQGLSCIPTAYPATTPCSRTITGDNSLADPASGQYVVANNGTTPIYWLGGTPQSAGPGVLSARTSNDPMYLLANHEGSDTRQCYDCLAVEAAVSSYFTEGVEVAYSGGTGYAASTPFTFSGGGTNCQGTGLMTASGGVPNGIKFQWGSSAVSLSTGIGNGCTSAPTVNLIGETGAGVTLIGYPTSVCGTYSIAEVGSTWTGTVTSATCSNQYFEPYSIYANQTPTSGAPMTWFINSLVDPVPGGAPRLH